MAATYVAQEASSPGSCLAQADRKKERSYGADAAVRETDLFPAALTIFGVPGKGFTSLLNRCAKEVPDDKGFVRHMLTALSVAVQVGNAKILTSAVYALRSNRVA